jgi:hypothetical protein
MAKKSAKKPAKKSAGTSQVIKSQKKIHRNQQQ